MKRLNTITKVGRPIVPRNHIVRALSTTSKALPTKALLRNTTSISALNTIPLQYSRYASTTTSDTPSEPLQKTPLYDFHVANGAKMVPFSGFSMPVQYDSLSVSASHHFTRSHCSIFDVSHMVQHNFSGPGAAAFFEQITPAGIKDLKANTSGLTALLLPETGGIVDDTIVTKLKSGDLYVVTNAGCREKDLKYFKKYLAEWKGEPVKWEVLGDQALIALQGPLSAEILSSVLEDRTKTDLEKLYFGQCTQAALVYPGNSTRPVTISRGGYTGEDGFEISMWKDDAEHVVKALLNAGGKDKIAMAGLGARDSLRLEAGMCLYGHDLDETVTPVEASLSWIIGKNRKVEGGFHGDKVILDQLKPKSKGGAGVERRRVGLVVDGAPAREGAEILNAEGEKIGIITSGCPSPTLKKNIAMAYIKDGSHKSGTEVDVLVRGKKRKAVVTKMPFIQTNYWKGMAPA